MRTMNSLLGAAAALSLVATPVLAQSNPASKLSVAKAPARATTAAPKGSQLAGGIIPLIAIAAFVAGAVIVLTESDDEPDSP